MGPLEGSWAVTPDAPIQLEEVEGLPPNSIWAIRVTSSEGEMMERRGRNWPGMLGSKQCEEKQAVSSLSKSQTWDS